VQQRILIGLIPDIAAAGARGNHETPGHGNDAANSAGQKRETAPHILASGPVALLVAPVVQGAADIELHITESTQAVVEVDHGAYPIVMVVRHVRVLSKQE